jgi:hypothetical protein
MVRVSSLDGGPDITLDVDRVDFSSADAGVASVNPASDNSYLYETDVSPDGVGGPVTITADVYLTGGSGGVDCSGTVDVTVAAPSSWFQTEEGDVYIGGDLDNPIPTSAPEQNFSVGDPSNGGGTWGVVVYDSSAGATTDFGDGYPSNNDSSHWLVDDSQTALTWDYFNSIIQEDDGDPVLADGEPASGTYKISGDQTVDDAWTISDGQTVLIIVNGSLDIEANITVAEGGHLTMIVSGDINIDPAVTDVQGVFIADGTLTVETNGGTDVQFRGEGVFSAGTVDLQRNLQEGNETQPAEVFASRPDFWLNTPDTIWQAAFSWTELAP